LLALTKQVAPKPIGKSAVKCYLYNKIDAACLYLENEGNETVTCNFKMKLVNLKFEDSDSTEFEAVLGPRQSCFKVLRPIIPGEGTSVGYSITTK
jgi:hypothetical protein